MWTIKDSYSIHQIEETLDSLNGAEWFTSLDLKSGYWQVEMEEDCKALTAFTVSPLGFYECERMPFDLTNDPATFQHLMQSCLGNLDLQYCIICLDDIIVFTKTPEEHLVSYEPFLKNSRELNWNSNHQNVNSLNKSWLIFRPCCIQKWYINWSQKGRDNPEMACSN